MSEQVIREWIREERRETLAAQAERDRARATAVALEQENAQLRTALARVIETAGCSHAWEKDVAAARAACDFCQNVWSAMDLLDRIDNPREDTP